MKEFFGIGGYTREPEGYFSWQHLVFVTVLMIIMVAAAILLGKRFKNSDIKCKNRVILVSAIIMDFLELVKIVLRCVEYKSITEVFYVLPLFLCSIQLITIPLAALSCGRVKEASLDFIMIFGVLGAVLGTYAAGNNYAAYPVLSYTNVGSGLTHAISGFVAIYIGTVGLTSLKKKNIYITYTILFSFCISAYIANIFTDCNYMFLSRGDGTPYDIIYNLVNGNKVLYPLIVVLLFVIYIAAFYYIYYFIKAKKEKNKTASECKEADVEAVNV